MLRTLFRFTALHGNGALPKRLACNSLPQPSSSSPAPVSSSSMSETKMQQGINFSFLFMLFLILSRQVNTTQTDVSNLRRSKENFFLMNTISSRNTSSLNLNSFLENILGWPFWWPQRRIRCSQQFLSEDLEMRRCPHEVQGRSRSQDPNLAASAAGLSVPSKGCQRCRVPLGSTSWLFPTAMGDFQSPCP